MMNGEEKLDDFDRSPYYSNVIDTTDKAPDVPPNEKKPEAKPKQVSALTLFQFAEPLDILLMIIGTLGSMASGASFPFMLVLFTNIIDLGIDFSSVATLATKNCSNSINLTNYTFPNVTASADQFLDNMKTQAIYLSILGVVTTFFGYFQVAFWLMPAERQVKFIRQGLLKAILRQEIGWFDTYKSGELTNRLTDDVNKIKDGIGDKLGNAIQFFSTFVSGIIIGFVRGWKLTLVILSISPVLFAASFVFTKLLGYLTTNELKSYAKAGAVAEEVLTAIRTVFAFNGAKKEHKRYDEKLEEARRYGIKKSFINGILIGFVFLVINCAYALGFWYGWTLTIKKDGGGYSVGKILLVFFSIIISVFSLGNAAPFFTTFASAQAAAYEVFNIINRQSKINHESTGGKRPNNVTGNIEFEDVAFKYPARANVQVLKNLTLKIKPGQTVALVGSSGCGKSTVVQLLQRFYDPEAGSITIDGNDIKELNLHWLRTQIGVVNQEPILFATSIADNIKMGRDGVTQAEIEYAAKNANAHDFIMTLPDRYDTLVGNRGSQLSGGQKQRVAIARALVRNPKILLLDEATSALDNESEGIVQEALDQARLGRTTIVIAHRLSTIRNADVIFAMKDGKVFESGTHDELMARGGLYHSLVVTQSGGKIQIKNKKANKKVDANNNEKEADDSNKSHASDVKDGENGEKKDKEPEPSMGRILTLSKPETMYIVFGCFASLISGSINPAFAIVFSKVINVFSDCEDKQEAQIIMYCLIFIGFGIATLFSNFFQSAMFGISGENLTRRLRSQGFKSMLSQDIGWFDSPENNIGALTTRLAVEAAAVQGATGIRIGTVLMNISNLGVGLVLALYYGWAITLVILAFIPFMIISGVLQTKMMTGFSAKDKEVLEEAGQISNQAISNIRTVAILNKEDYFYQEYSKKIFIPYKAAMRSANLYGFMLGFTNSIIFYAQGAAYVMGAYLIKNNKFGVNFEGVMIVFSAIIFGAQSVGQASSMMPDYAKAKAAANKMFQLFDRKPVINNWESESKETVSDKEFDSTIVMDSLEFRYPSRPDAPVLQNLSLTVRQGQRVALVGSSGCGKSTVTQLLERFYDSDSGQITISNLDIRNADLFWLRSQMGIVSQEPILFDQTIAENIAYGDNSRKVSTNEIMEAAKQANIHNFIQSLPQGYETNVGSKGTQLSGGQKQRIAIARALVRNPKILLLDEATSALDTESEKIVQEALDKAQQGRTCIIIAHRLTTIKNADIIYVIKEGRIIEQGNHDELINLKGFYSQLYNSH